MPSEEEKLARARRLMIDQHLRGRGITSARLLEAFDRVPRERFIPAKYRGEAYADHPLPIGWDQTISQPYVVALMIQELDVRPAGRVLDVGAGSGYQTALLAMMGGEVHAVERIAELADQARGRLGELSLDNAHVHVGDGSAGLTSEAPFDRIICGAAAPDLPAPWLEQLADGGRIVLPTGNRGVQSLFRIEKQGRDVRRYEICGVRFVPLIGEHGWEQ